MRILGIDPGYAILGYGVVDAQGGKSSVVDYGVIETAAGEPFPERLEKLYAGTRQLIGLHKPDQAVFEELFFYRNTTTAISVGAGRGVALLAAQQFPTWKLPLSSTLRLMWLRLLPAAPILFRTAQEWKIPALLPPKHRQANRTNLTQISPRWS